MKSDNFKIPDYSKLVEVTYAALKLLGGSGKNNEINDKAAELLHLSDDVCSIPHQGSSSMSEINYRLAWARTLLKNYGAIENSARSVWSITTAFSNIETLILAKTIVKTKMPQQINPKEIMVKRLKWKRRVLMFPKK